MAGSYCDSDRSVPSCENNLDCSNGVCTEVTLGSKLVRMCKEECNGTSDSCPENKICVGKNKLC